MPEIKLGDGDFNGSRFRDCNKRRVFQPVIHCRVISSSGLWKRGDECPWMQRAVVFMETFFSISFEFYGIHGMFFSGHAS